MKKKLLPYILGCSMAVAMTSLAAHAETYHHVGMDILNDGTSSVQTSSGAANGRVNSSDYTTLVGSGDTQTDSHNEFTEYNNGATGNDNVLGKTFGTNSTATGSVVWTTGALGNTRTTTNDIQTAYPVTVNNEVPGYRTDNETSGNDLADDLATLDPTNNPYKPFSEVSNDDFDNGNDTFTAGQDTGVTDLETAIPVYNLTIPARTVLPIGATHWRLGNVAVNGKYFVRPDKVDVTVSQKQNLHHKDYKTAETEASEFNAPRVIPFTVSDKRFTDANLGASDHRYFFQNGGSNVPPAEFPHAYTAYTSDNYVAGKVSDINETHQVWLNSTLSDWQGKTRGKYTGQITFSAAIVTTDNDTAATTNMYTDTYPAEGNETQP